MITRPLVLKLFTHLDLYEGGHQMFKLLFMCKKAMSKPRYIQTTLPVQKGTKFKLLFMWRTV